MIILDAFTTLDQTQAEDSNTNTSFSVNYQCTARCSVACCCVNWCYWVTYCKTLDFLATLMKCNYSSCFRVKLLVICITKICFCQSLFWFVWHWWWGRSDPKCYWQLNAQQHFFFLILASENHHSGFYLKQSRCDFQLEFKPSKVIGRTTLIIHMRSVFKTALTELWKAFRKPGELLLRTTFKNFKKFFLLATLLLNSK